MSLVLSALLLGLVGSGHCAAMCGPLVLFTTPGHPSRLARWRHIGLYHSGRLAIYGALGAVAGGLGHAAVAIGFGRALAIAAGAVLVVQALIAVRPTVAPGWLTRATGMPSRLVQRARSWTVAHRIRGPIVGGVFNGLLPCGLVYSAAAVAVGLGDAPDAIGFMLAFGVGTVPILALTALSGARLVRRAPVRLRRLAPFALAGLGVLLVVRGVKTPAPHGHPSGPPPHQVHAGSR